MTIEAINSSVSDVSSDNVAVLPGLVTIEAETRPVFVVNRHALNRTDRVQWMEQLRTDYAGHVLESWIPDREIIAAATSSSSPLPVYGSRAVDVNEVLDTIAKHILPTAVTASVDV